MFSFSARGSPVRSFSPFVSVPPKTLTIPAALGKRFVASRPCQQVGSRLRNATWFLRANDIALECVAESAKLLGWSG